MKRWNRIEDKLPDTNRKFGESEYLLCYDSNHYETFVAYYNSKSDKWKLAHYTTHSNPVQVTHWRELPKRPTH